MDIRQGQTIIAQIKDDPNAPVHELVVIEVGPLDGVITLADVGTIQVPEMRVTPKQLAAWMNDNNITQNKLAELLKVPQPTVSYWLNGKRRIPRKLQELIQPECVDVLSRIDRLNRLQSLEIQLREIMDEIKDVL